ncbi:MAG: 1-acyl-sn-glycerol-3-phosphate acyltransferase [Proteobacteria bacterium]|jgi:lysophosphatidate acyltransferase|nr:1-acyl-sn-glycerol-3-phosphate acyltransferase [Pseudomonadota bacterium]
MSSNGHSTRALLVTLIRMGLGLWFLFAIFPPVLLVLIILLPWRMARVRFTNHVGTLMGWTIMRISGCPITIEGREHFDGSQPVICIGNHTSITDAFTSVWMVPTGTVGVAKKRILNYPVYGQIWYLSGHMVIDRSNTEKAKESLRKMAVMLREHGLSILLWPEGTRSRDGRLQQFKKGFAHLAIETGHPIVPMVTTGALNVWQRGHIHLRKVPIHIKFLPPIETKHWKVETVNEHTAEVRQIIADALPKDQKPPDEAQAPIPFKVAAVG